MIDSTIIRAHQQAATVKRGPRIRALGRSRGGLTTKVHMLAATFGRPLRFRVTPGQASDITAAPGLLEGQQAKAVLRLVGIHLELMMAVARWIMASKL